MQAAFQLPPSQKYNFVKGKAVDVVTMVIVGFVLLVSVAISGTLQGLAGQLIDALGLSDSWVGAPLVWTLGVVLGVASSTLLFFIIYRVLGDPDLDRWPVLQGAILGAVAFEALKLLVVYVLGAIGGSKFAPLAIAATLMIWINYFSRLVFYGASWAMTARQSANELVLVAARRLAAETAAKLGDEAPTRATPVGAKPDEAVRGMPQATLAGRFDAGSAIAGAAAAAVAALYFWRRD